MFQNKKRLEGPKQIFLKKKIVASGGWVACAARPLGCGCGGGQHAVRGPYILPNRRVERELLGVGEPTSTL